MKMLCRTVLAAACLSSAVSAAASVDDAAKMGASAMNPGSRLGFVERNDGGEFKVHCVRELHRAPCAEGRHRLDELLGHGGERARKGLRPPRRFRAWG